MNKISHKLMIVCPYLYAVVMAALFLLSRKIDALDNDVVIFLIMGIFLILPVALCAVYLLTVFVGHSPQMLAKQNLQRKLFYLPLFALAVGILTYTVISTNRAAADGAMEGGLGVFLWFLLLLPVFVYGFLQMIVSAIVCAKIDEITRNTPQRIGWYHILLHLIPAVDIFSALRVHQKL